MSRLPVPTDEDFRAESIRFLKTCAAYCTCPNGWHFIWSAFKASGRRRSVYFQQPMLEKLLAPVLSGGVRRILIAGSADAGILSVLASIFGARVDYFAIDICAAPLQELRDHASRKGLSLRCLQTSLQDFVLQETFDLVFVHNTMYFLKPQEVGRVLRQLGQGMHANSWMVCGMRYERHPAGLSGTDPAKFAAATRAMISATYADCPDLIRLIDPHVDAYAATHCLGGFHRYEPAEFEAILEAAGYVTLDRCTDTLTPAATLNHSSTNSDVLSEVLLVELRAGRTGTRNRGQSGANA